jgi:hypothetical protein
VGDPGKIAYEAYAAHTEGRSLRTGEALADWEDLPLEYQTAWRVSADAVIQAVLSE